MKLRSSIVLLSLAALAAPLAAADLDRFASRRYVVHTDMEREHAKPISDHMDRVFDEYRRRLGRAGFKLRHNAPMNLYLFATQESYVEHLATLGVNAQNTGGMFFWRDGRGGLAIWTGRRSPANYLSTAQHEGFHQFAFMSIGNNLPTWANEGLAEYFGDALLVDGRFEMGQVSPHRLRQLRAAIDAGNAFGFGELLNMSGEEWINRVNSKDQRTGLMYTQSWSIVHFLVHGNGGRFERAFMAYLRELSKGRSSEQAFEAAFGSNDYPPFEKAWKRYIAQLNADPLTVAVERATFMADGLLTLHQRGRDVKDIDQLRRELAKIDFRYTFSSHGNRKVLAARDKDNFQPPPADRPSRTPRIELQEPAAADQPPGLRITGLKNTVAVRWSRNAEDGSLVYEVVLQ